MRDKEEFFNILNSIDRKDAAEYERLIGDFDFSRYVLKLNRIQEDADESANLFILRVPQHIAGFPPHLFNTPVRRTALEDYLTRRVAAQIDALSRYDDEGISRRRLSIACPGQKILPRSSLLVTEEYVEARVYVRLPAHRGLVSGAGAKEIFFEDLPEVVNSALIYCNLPPDEIEEFVDLMEDADRIRQVLPTRGWVSFVAEGALVARAAGSDLPNYARLQPIAAPDALISEVPVAKDRTIRGVGIPAGITLIIGDAYSGRIDLMHALAAGIYNHIPGDGRELVITVPDAVYLAAETGRSIQRVDVSPFIRQPGQEVSLERPLTCENADACAAQAATAMELLEVGARVMLIDEADSAPEFITQDSRTAALYNGATRAVTPLALRAAQFSKELGVSLVVAGSACIAEFIPLADTILRIDNFRLSDITADAKKLVREAPGPKPEVQDLAGLADKNRWIVPSSIDPSLGRNDASIRAVDIHLLEFGRSAIDLRGIRQLADVYQTRTIGRILYYAKLRYMDQARPIREILDLIDRDLSTEGLETLTRELRGDLARPRRYEIAMALNRLRTLRISSVAG